MHMVATDPGGCSGAGLSCGHGVVMVQTGCLVHLDETCSLQTILILTLYYCPIVSNSVGQGQLNWTWFSSRYGARLGAGGTV